MNEYICVCVGVEREGNAVSVAVNRATAGKDDIKQVFGKRIGSQTVIISDGAKGYGILAEGCGCTVLNANRDSDCFLNINTVNSYHSFIKERNRAARGFATKYLNRYNALFSKVFRAGKAVIDDIHSSLLCDTNDSSSTIHESQTHNLLCI
jgi:hypothetical protein